MRDRKPGKTPTPLWEEQWLIILTAACVGLPLSGIMWAGSSPNWESKAWAALPFLTSLIAGYLIRELGRFVDRRSKP